MMVLIMTPAVANAFIETSRLWLMEPVALRPVKAIETAMPKVGQIALGTAVTLLVLTQGASYAMVFAQRRTTDFPFVKDALIAEGHAQGHAEGRAQERAERDAQWNAWLARQQEALKQGQPFSEPPPGSNGS